MSSFKRSEKLTIVLLIIAILLSALSISLNWVFETNDNLSSNVRDISSEDGSSSGSIGLIIQETLGVIK